MAAVSAPSPTFVARAFVSPSWCGCALLSLCWEREFGPPSAVGRALLPHPGGSFVGGATGSLSSLWSRIAAPDHHFHCHRRSSSGRCSFIISSSAWRAHDDKSYGDSNVWSWSLAMAGGCSFGFITHRFFGPDWSCGEQRRSPVLFSIPAVFFCVFLLLSRVLFKKRICNVPPGAI
jgi:hypothetical protein